MPENFESQQYRDELADEIKNAPKEERTKILDEAKGDPEYWKARDEKMSERESEEEINGGMGVLVKHKTLYHGSGNEGIDKFNKAEEDTVGSGVYFTSDAASAIGYARNRAGRINADKEKEKAKPVIYETVVENLKLLDLRKDENVKGVLEGYKEVLMKKWDPSLPQYMKSKLRELVREINSNKIRAGNLKLVTQAFGGWFSEYVESLGYNGLVTFEGGMEDVGDHDSYVIFNPENTKIIEEHNIEVE